MADAEDFSHPQTEEIRVVAGAVAFSTARRVLVLALALLLTALAGWYAAANFAISTDLKQEVSALGQQIEALADGIQAQRQQTMSQVELAVVVMVVAMVLLAVVSALVTRRYALQPLRNLREPDEGFLNVG